MFGGQGEDVLKGGTGDDWLNGGDGADVLDGEEGCCRLSLVCEGVEIDLEKGTGKGGWAEGACSRTSKVCVVPRMMILSKVRMQIIGLLPKLVMTWSTP